MKNILLISFLFLCASCYKKDTVVINKSTNNDAAITSRPDHIVVVIEENHSYSEIINNAGAPYINALSKDAYSTLFTRSFAVTHPSQPNYLDLYSGSNQGVTNDNHSATAPFTAANLGAQ